MKERPVTSLPPAPLMPPSPAVPASDPTPVAAFSPPDISTGPAGECADSKSGDGPGTYAGPIPVGGEVKRVFDLLVGGAACLLLLLLAPLLLPLILAIAADGGPVLFRQSRIGVRGQPFFCLKFRTMLVNADRALAEHLARDAAAAAEWERDHKLRQDPRITKVGRFLRKSSLDELPQIINVLRGEMSLVGPRPIVAAEIPRYGAFFDDYCRTRPGITGLWQVSGRNDVDYPTRVRLDSSYARSWSLGKDIAIILRTVPALLSSRGAH